MKYNYQKAINRDVINYIRNNYNVESMTDEEWDELPDKLNYELWVEDSVTGNGSGSYTFSRAKAKRYVIENLDLFALAAEEFCIEHKTIAEKLMSEDWEYFDVTIRCYLLSNAIYDALESMPRNKMTKGKKFEVGKEYEANDPGYDPIKVLRRTEKSIVVNNGNSTRMMRIRTDEQGDEFVVDHSVPPKWQDTFRYSARQEA